MSSKFRSGKSYPAPAHVCHAEIPGNPQPPSGPPDVFFATFSYVRNVPPETTPTTVALILIKSPIGAWNAAPALSPEGWRYSVIFVYSPIFNTWSCNFRMLDGITPKNPAAWTTITPTSVNPWYNAPIEKTVGATYKTCTVTFFA